MASRCEGEDLLRHSGACITTHTATLTLFTGRVGEHAAAVRRIGILVALVAKVLAPRFFCLILALSVFGGRAQIGVAAVTCQHALKGLKPARVAVLYHRDDVATLGLHQVVKFVGIVSFPNRNRVHVGIFVVERTTQTSCGVTLGGVGPIGIRTLLQQSGINGECNAGEREKNEEGRCVSGSDNL